jgi:hypothetical protein
MKKPGVTKIEAILSETPLVGEDDILSDLTEEKATSLFLGRYTMTEVIAVLGKRGFFKEARKRGLWPLVFDLDSSEYPTQRLRIFIEEKQPEKLIVDLKIREGRLIPKDNSRIDPVFYNCNFLFLEWLTIQNPLQSFSKKRPPLPGQSHPGLGLGKRVVDIFIYLARLTRKDGLLAFPAYFHNALLFSRYFCFIDPEKAAEVLAIEKALPDIPFKHLAWIAHLNCLRTGAGETYEWKAQEMVYPLNKALKAFFESKGYKNRLRQGMTGRSFSVDWDGYERKIDGLLEEQKR